MMRDLKSKLAVVNAFGPVTINANNTPAAIDLAGFHSAIVALNVGIGGIIFDATNKIEFVLTHSDDNVTYSNVVDADIQGVTGISNGIVRSLTANKAAADASPTLIGYVGNKRYLKVLAQFSGTHATGTPIAVSVIKGNAVYKP